MAGPTPQRRFQNPALFVCDIQTAFRQAIHSFPSVVQTTTKLIRFSGALSIPIYVTTQNRARLGDTVPELASALAAAGPDLVRADVDKTRFSMYLPEISSQLPPGSEVVIVGIESHICVTQTALDLLQAGHKVYVAADGVSSSNKDEVPVALARLRAAGAVVTSSESWMYECMGDAGIPEFKSVIGVVKDTMKDTKEAWQGLVGSKI
ncbi:hypothetical protein QBC42DRAFT_178595 [Cladorrhinum samala]|uniref:Isochorismatase-like domain-containing protein n=1 Tax=Cladorrhinum samala TaxID=585594 RepID=A0AAV9HMV7_9PEZI|nr:hypothetical protein QBC42DRAFT_178595 [Cladorrhinum samala]